MFKPLGFFANFYSNSDVIIHQSGLGDSSEKYFSPSGPLRSEIEGWYCNFLRYSAPRKSELSGKPQGTTVAHTFFV